MKKGICVVKPQRRRQFFIAAANQNQLHLQGRSVDLPQDVQHLRGAVSSEQNDADRQVRIEP
jgi:hypothetical protein